MQQGKLIFALSRSDFIMSLQFPIQSCRNISCTWYVIIALTVLSTSLFNFSSAPSCFRFFDLYRKWDISAKSTRGINTPPHHLSFRYYREWNTVISAMQYIRGPALLSPISTENRLNIASCDWRDTLRHRDGSDALRCDAKPRNKHERTAFPQRLSAIGLVASVAGMSSPGASGSSSIHEVNWLLYPIYL